MTWFVKLKWKGIVHLSTLPSYRNWVGTSVTLSPIIDVPEILPMVRKRLNKPTRTVCDDALYRHVPMIPDRIAVPTANET